MELKTIYRGLAVSGYRLKHGLPLLLLLPLLTSLTGVLLLDGLDYEFLIVVLLLLLVSGQPSNGLVFGLLHLSGGG